jgi:hypothetical protein
MPTEFPWAQLDCARLLGLIRCDSLSADGLGASSYFKVMVCRAEAYSATR